MTHTRIDVRRILCPVDFSESSSRALEHAVRLASFFDASVHLLHVLPRLVDVLDAIVVPVSATQDSTRDKAMDSLLALAAEFGDWRVPIEPAVRAGKPASQIEDMARDLPADVIVMGTRGRTGLPHSLLGSVAEKVMNRVACPVMAVGGRAGEVNAPPYRRILCPTALGPGSDHTIDFAFALATESDAQVEFLHVVEAIALDPKGGHSLDTDEEVRALRRRLMAKADLELRRALPTAMRRLVDVRRRVSAGEAWPAIVEAARTGRADVIVMGTHARPVDRMLFGSTTQRVIREASCGVLVVHQPVPAKPARREHEVREDRAAISPSRAGRAGTP